MQIMAVLIVLHILSAVIWVGGMFFAYVCLRPTAACQLEPALRLPLWRGTLKRFFRWVWLAILLLLITGHSMIVQFGGMANVGLYIHIMLGLGYLMVLLYLYLFFVPYRQLIRTTAEHDWQAAGRSLNQIRLIVAVNLTLGILTVAIATGGRYGF